MKKLLSTFTLILLFIAYTIIQANSENRNLILDELKNQIEGTHPTPYTNISKKEFETHLEILKKNWNKQDAIQQYFSLRYLVALIGDAHTQVFKQIENDKVLPFFALPYGDHSIIVQAEEAYKDLVGKELIAINGIKIKTILQKLLPIISHDKEEWAYLNAHYEIRLFSNLKYIGTIKKGNVVGIKIKDITTEKTKTIKVAFSENMQINNPVFANLSPTLFQSGYYRANILKDMLFIQYNVCADFPDMPMKEFASRIKQLPEVKKIIVDLRHNSGGDSEVIMPLVEVLKDTTENKGTPLFALIGNGTFSSGIMAALDLKEIGATLIGEEMGWDGKFGEVKEIQLSDGYTLFCSTKDFSQNIKETHPDIIMMQDIKDLEAGLDTLIEAIRKM